MVHIMGVFLLIMRLSRILLRKILLDNSFSMNIMKSLHV